MPTEPSTERDRVFRFGPFELSEREGELRKSGVRIKLQEQPFPRKRRYSIVSIPTISP